MSADNQISDALALTIPCPLCGVSEYVQCVYVWPKGVRECHFPEGWDSCVQHSESQHERLAKVGTSTKITHNARKNQVFTRKIRERQLELLEQLRDWLTDYGDIFEEDDGDN